MSLSRLTIDPLGATITVTIVDPNGVGLSLSDGGAVVTSTTITAATIFYTRKTGAVQISLTTPAGVECANLDRTPRWVTVSGDASISAQFAATPGDYIGKLGFGGYRSGQYYETKGASTGTRSFTADDAYLVPYIVRSRQAFDRIGVELAVAGTGSTLFRLGIWNTHTDGMPGTVALDAGTVDGVAATGWLENAIAVTLEPGLYWLGAVGQTLTGSPTLRAANTHNVGWANVPSVGAASASLGLNSCLKYTEVSGALASLAGVAAAGGVVLGPCVALRAV